MTALLAIFKLLLKFIAISLGAVFVGFLLILAFLWVTLVTAVELYQDAILDALRELGTLPPSEIEVKPSNR